MADAERVFRLLLLAATADRSVAPEERKLLLAHAARLGISTARAEKLLAEVARGGEIPIALPTDPAEREQTARAILDIVCADAAVGEQERALLRRILPKLSISEAEIDQALEARLWQPPGHRRMKGHIQAIVLCLRAGAILGALALYQLLVEILRGDRVWDDLMRALPATAITGAILVLYFWLGSRLARYSNGARLTTATLSLLAALAAIVLSLVTFFGEAGRRAPPGQIAFLLIVMGLTAAWSIAMAATLLSTRAMFVCGGDSRPVPSPALATASPFLWLALAQAGVGLAILWAWSIACRVWESDHGARHHMGGDPVDAPRGIHAARQRRVLGVP